MVISYLGGECIKVTQGDLTLAFNPPSKDSSLKSSRFGADIALVSLDNEDFNGTENARFGEREPFVINGPGEYEVKGVAVRGFGSESAYGMSGESKGINTIYSVVLEGMNLCFLGALGSVTLPPAAKQELDDIDILFVPIGGDGVLGYEDAYKLALQLGPKAVVPMHYGDIGGKDALKAFLKEAGIDTKPVDKLTIKKKDLDGKEGEIIVLAA
jgi:L-ascorbate metabolism protein UlaG (beta-lactamase superfamily)